MPLRVGLDEKWQSTKVLAGKRKHMKQRKFGIRGQTASHSY